MKFVIKFIVVCCPFFFLLKACTQPYQGVAMRKVVDNKPAELLRSDGLYNTYDTSLMPCGDIVNNHYRIYSPLYILNEGNAIYLNGGGDTGTSFSSLDYFQNLKSYENIVGEINIENAKIKATLPIGLYVRGMRLKMFTAYFEGEIKNRDTIINWRMVPPYPKAPKKFNNDFKRLVEPKLLYFIESKELSGLDSLYQEKLRENEKRKN